MRPPAVVVLLAIIQCQWTTDSVCNVTRALFLAKTNNWHISALWVYGETPTGYFGKWKWWDENWKGVNKLSERKDHTIGLKFKIALYDKNETLLVLPKHLKANKDQQEKHRHSHTSATSFWQTNKIVIKRVMNQRLFSSFFVRQSFVQTRTAQTDFLIDLLYYPKCEKKANW